MLGLVVRRRGGRARISVPLVRSSASHSAGPAAAYERMVLAGNVRDDPRQRSAVAVLQRSFERIVRPPLEDKKEPSWFGLSWRREVPAPDRSPPVNVYLHGSVGTGKSFLMDLFFDALPSDHAKRRVHFHDFMQDVHRRIHLWRAHERSHRDDDPIPPVAAKLGRAARVLCFDEFQVTDVADAMVLKRLFEHLLAGGTHFVITTNRVPEELYKGGLNRQLFAPFVSGVLRTQFQIVDLSSSNDYRLVGSKSPRALYLQPLASAEMQQRFDATFDDLTHREPVAAEELVAFGERKIVVPETARGVCRYRWQQLMQQNYGAADFLAIARRYHTVMLRDVPRMTVGENAQARRFITLVDALYERRCKLILLADGPPESLFPSERDAHGAAHEEVFAWRRTVSRLAEMSSTAYCMQAHRPD